MRQSRAAIVCGVLIAAGTAVLAARVPRLQDPQQQPPVFRGRTDIVTLDVSVLDKKRKPVHGLKESDFTILEDGKPQEIVALSEISPPDDFIVPVWHHAAPPDVSTNEVGDKRLFAIILEAYPARRPIGAGIPSRAMGPGTTDPAIEIARAIVERLRPGDMAAIINPFCSHPFTDDLESLRNAIDSLKPFGPPCRSHIGPLNPDRVAQQEAPHYLIRNLAEYLTVVPQRRKAIVYIGFGSFSATPPPRTGPRSSVNPLDELRETFWFAQFANVNIYAISPYAFNPERGIGGTPDTLRILANNTGGLATTDGNQAEDVIDQMFLENSSYYMLGYRTAHPEMDGKYRRLSVKVAGHGDLTVHVRSMWYRPKVSSAAKPADAMTPSKNTSLSMAGLLPDLDLSFNAAAMPFAMPNGRPTIAIVAEMAEPVLPRTTRVVQRVDLRMIAYGDAGNVRADVTTRTDLDAVPQTDDQVRYAVFSRLDLGPGRYSLRVVAHNVNTDKVGSTEFDIAIPDFAREAVSLSGVALTMASNPALPSFGTLRPLSIESPTATRLFTTSDKVGAFVRVYQVASDQMESVQLTAHILDAAGTSVFSAVEPLGLDRFTGAGTADYRLTLPLEQLRAGPYLLTMEAALGSKRTPRRDVRFAIR